MAKMTYNNFLEKLYGHESQGNGSYKAENKYGYLGRYQLGTEALQSAGYKNDKEGWVGKNGISNKDDFKANPIMQEDAVRTYHADSWQHIKNAGYDKYVGQTINGVEITPYGLLAGYHLKGNSGLKKFLESNGAIDPVDKNGMPISKYIKDMAGEGGMPSKNGLNIPRDNDDDYTQPLGLPDPNTDIITGSSSDNEIKGSAGDDTLGTASPGFFGAIGGALSSSVGGFFSSVFSGIGGALSGALGSGGGNGGASSGSFVADWERNPMLDAINGGWGGIFSTIMDRMGIPSRVMTQAPTFDIGSWAPHPMLELLNSDQFPAMMGAAKRRRTRSDLEDIIFDKGDFSNKGPSFGGMLSDMVSGAVHRQLGQIMNRNHTSISSHKSARSIEANHGFRLSQSQQSAELLKALQRAKRNL